MSPSSTFGSRGRIQTSGLRLAGLSFTAIFHCTRERIVKCAVCSVASRVINFPFLSLYFLTVLFLVSHNVDGNGQGH